MDTNQYNFIGTDYTRYSALTAPHAKLVSELVAKALGDCGGKSVLDLGGGDGLHARKALAAGAEYVDVVDVSEVMVDIGKRKATTDGERIHWFVADAVKPLSEQCRLTPPDGKYDIVMGNWLFDSAVRSEEDFEPLWRNIVHYIKPGGKFLGVRSRYPGICGRAARVKYGLTWADVKDIPGGWRYRVVIHVDPPFTLQATTMRDSGTLTDEVPRRLGLTDFETVPVEETEMYKSDPEFWTFPKEKKKRIPLKMQNPLNLKGTLALFITASSLLTPATSQPLSSSTQDTFEPSPHSATLEIRSRQYPNPNPNPDPNQNQNQRWDGCRLTVSVLAPGDLTMDFAQRFGADPENVRTPEMARSVQVMKDAIAAGDQVRAHDALYTNCQASVRDDAIKHNTGRRP
ncbi:hypothetical protein CP532_0748 [Ophiocordyceps camponoti-leonardi (nom. inval.)]|nr:hypothetical protein CP532_0748 [Ophiocordyceps camponoti-leonardi (nom. inval.)]